MSEAISPKRSRQPEAKAPAGRLFFLDLSSGRVMTCAPDGKDLKYVHQENRKNLNLT